MFFKILNKILSIVNIRIIYLKGNIYDHHNIDSNFNRVFFYKKISKIKIEPAVEDLKVSGWIIMKKFANGIEGMFNKKIYPGYTSATSAIINIKLHKPDEKNSEFIVKPVYLLTKAQRRDLHIMEIIAK